MVKVLDIVENCYTWSTGEIVADVIRKSFARDEKIVLSFKDVTDIPSSFVNAAFISLLNDYSYDYIRLKLTLTSCSPQIVDMINQRFKFERERRDDRSTPLRA